MNTLKLVLIFVAIGFLQCKQDKPDDQKNGSLMEMDKNPADDKSVSLHTAKDTLRLEESRPALGENPNVTQMDMDVIKGERSNSVQLVKPGEKPVLEERPANK